jgi:glutamate-ammonia-ligase adenylyltransferase
MSANIILEPALAWSGALRRKLVAQSEFERWLCDAVCAPLTPAGIHAWFNELKQDTQPAQHHGEASASCAAWTDALPIVDVRHVLRRLRERIFFVAMVRDINGTAALSEIVDAMTAFADLAVAQAYKSVITSLAQVYGIPVDPTTGRPQEMLIFGMGKLGGKELNVSSDIDLIMLYGEEGETPGRRKTSHHEFYGEVTRRMMPVLSEMDADGHVFRTDCGPMAIQVHLPGVLTPWRTISLHKDENGSATRG